MNIHVPHTTPTKSHVASQFTALVVRTLEIQSPPLNQPLNLQIHTSVNTAVEMPICVFETECVGVDKIFYLQLFLNIEFFRKTNVNFEIFTYN